MQIAHGPSKLSGMLLLGTVLSGCATPLSTGTAGIEYGRQQIAGAIRFTDPRLFRRESLIKERRNEREYISARLKDTEKDDFRIQPEILREVEIVSSLAANLGIRFDPAAGLNFRRDEETTAAQQEIAMLRLQMELAQLRRDVQLFETNLLAQTEVSEANAIPGTTASAGDVQSNVQAPATADLLTAINGLQSSLTTRLSAPTAALSPGGGSVSPIEEFYDRASYRSVLTSYRNSAAHDEIHDDEGSALMRLSFSATVLPPPRIPAIARRVADARRPAGLEPHQSSGTLSALALAHQCGAERPRPGQFA